MPAKTDKKVKKVTVIHTDTPLPSEPPEPTITETEPTNFEVINYINNTKLQIFERIEQKNAELFENLKKYMESPKTPEPQPVVKQVPPPEPEKGKPWYKNWFAWVLSFVVLTAIGYGIYLLIMVESGKRIRLPW